ncbi:hypothetical protein QJS04_geneDACA019457 [Acorus gramineus]|uniref:RING-type domain-containing protein n=1 Tax=Acorus gramineus TaxID=55184 RepID=A0AAV9AAE9_ACOGR|nr:hypothetical protein QJS04_geneDACA019457 [Acorus gramineus]
MGSLCCVAARPHGSTACSRELSVVQNEPFWQTNTSFSPPLSRRWDHRFQSEVMSYESYGDGGIGSSFSSNSKESRSWVRGDDAVEHHYSASDGNLSYFDSPSDSLKVQHLMPPPLQGVNLGEYISAASREQTTPGALTFGHAAEGTSTVPYSMGSTPSHSDGSELDQTAKFRVPSRRSFSNLYSFHPKPVHPLTFPDQGFDSEAHGTCSFTSTHNKSISISNHESLSASPESGDTPHREAFRWSSGSSSIDSTDVSEQLDSEPPYNLSEAPKCGLCKRFLSHKSPWSTRRIVQSGDMPITGVLQCCHVYHAECLERTTPKSQKHDPPCPICERFMEDDIVLKPRVVCKAKHVGLSRLRSPVCGQVGDCMEGAVHTSPGMEDMPEFNALIGKKKGPILVKQLSLSSLSNPKGSIRICSHK